jgi:hypothetical protein
MNYRIYTHRTGESAIAHSRKNKRTCVVDTVDEKRTRDVCKDLKINLNFQRNGALVATQ